MHQFRYLPLEEYLLEIEIKTQCKYDWFVRYNGISWEIEIYRVSDKSTVYVGKMKIIDEVADKYENCFEKRGIKCTVIWFM